MDQRAQRKIFDDWLQRHKGILFKIVRANAFTPHDQDDLFQEITLKLWQSIPDFRGESKPSTWIYRVALFAASTWVRAEKKQPDTRPLADVAHTLSAATELRDERLEWLYAQIRALKPIDRALCLLLLEGFTYREMADMLGISESNVGVKIHRIKRSLVRKSREKVQHGV